jgi:hypothetical protein
MEETHHFREATVSSDNQQSKVIVHPLENRNWKVFRRRVPKSELVFFSQVIILYAMVCMCVFNFDDRTRRLEPVVGAACWKPGIRAA